MYTLITRLQFSFTTILENILLVNLLTTFSHYELRISNE